MRPAEVRPIACTLDAREMGLRLARIGRLTQKYLRWHRLEGQSLRLGYSPEGALEAQAIVALEKECCAFLDFEVRQVDSDLVLSITAPADIEQDAAWLFEQFLPSTHGAPDPGMARCCGSCA